MSLGASSRQVGEPDVAARLRILPAFAAAVALLGCASVTERAAEVAHELDPFASGSAVVVSTQSRGPYLDTTLDTSRRQLRFLTPATEACARVLDSEKQVTYAKLGNFGRISSGRDSCDPVGVASLAAWRDRRPRDVRPPAFPRARSSFREIHRDETGILLRGRFPLAARVGIPGGWDLVALVPVTEVCEAVVARGETSLEFRDIGREPFRLVGEDGVCPILGFALPPAPADASASTRGSAAEKGG